MPLSCLVQAGVVLVERQNSLMPWDLWQWAVWWWAWARWVLRDRHHDRVWWCVVVCDVSGEVVIDVSEY